MKVSGAGFLPIQNWKVALPWTYVCCMPSVVISVLSFLSRGSKSLWSTADANVNSEENSLRILWYVVDRYAPGA